MATAGGCPGLKGTTSQSMRAADLPIVFGQTEPKGVVFGSPLLKCPDMATERLGKLDASLARGQGDPKAQSPPNRQKKANPEPSHSSGFDRQLRLMMQARVRNRGQTASRSAMDQSVGLPGLFNNGFGQTTAEFGHVIE